MTTNSRQHLVAAILTVLFLLASSSAQAAGFGLNEHGAKAMAMAGAYTAIADRAEAIFYNPAGIGALKGLNVDLGVTMVTPGASYTGIAPMTGTEATVDANRNFFWLPNLHLSYRFHERVAVGFGMYIPFGLTMEWADKATVDGKEVGWWGRGTVRKISLETIYFNPTVAFMVHPRIYLGGGVTIAKGAVGLSKAVALSADPADDVNVELSAGAVGVGGTAGVLVKILPDMLNFGFTFRSGVTFNFEGNAAFTKGGLAASVPTALRSQLVDSPAATSVSLPHTFSFGVAAFPVKGLTLGFVTDVITWSSYDKLEVTFKDVKDPTKVNPNLSTSDAKNWKNTVCVRLGAEYRVLPAFPLRLGFIWDQGPVPMSTVGPELPDADRYEVTIGGGYEFKGFKVDLAYQFLTTGTITPERSAPLQSLDPSVALGSYKASAHLVGLSLGYSLDI